MNGNKDPIDPQVAQKLLDIIHGASEKALLTAVEALAEQTGHPLVRGLPVRQFYAQERDKCIEEEVAHLADLDHADASAVKRLFDKWKSNHGNIS